ncbi:hypothetical protein CFC21_006394 [Triticum aestivum]|uniref:Uncharacterized protein n=3 Tax=Triticum TaxID=4564 RepID=A0A9R0QRZ8_TRITD|nr:uncharacterized protein LOC123121042 [Triticum aestivum]KAF6988990.1 hypothetical protein CFC21_006394 [Triticum aestivum]VAH16240.1 unnamed protein product [Triticum turgidum subsp. durum]
MADREAPPGSGIGAKRRCRDAGAAAGLPDPAAAAGGGNRLLAGYLAHEFLARGTVLGERRAPGGQDTGSEASQGRGQAARYEAVAALVQVGGAYVPGVVNPAQLAAPRGRRTCV